MLDPGYVYLVTHANAGGNHKIGLTRNPPERIKQLGGEDCTVLAMVMCIDPEKVEALLHKRFASKRMPQSEWFKLNRDEIQEVCDVLLIAHEEANQYVVLPSLPPEPTPEPTPKSTPEPSFRKKYQHDPSDPDYRASDWQEVGPDNLAGYRNVFFIPGRGYCVRRK